MSSYQNLFSFTDKVAVVTGAAGILGSEFCEALCSMGGVVACLDIQQEALQALVAKLSAVYGSDKVAGFICDVSDPISVKQTTNDIIQRFSKIDILLNNAASNTDDLDAYFAPFEEYSLNTWREVMATNLDGMFLVAQAIGKHMIERKQGVIVQTASIYSLHGSDNRIYEGSFYMNRQINNPAVYTASKAGVIGLTKQLATNWAEHGIRVNTLCPGGVSSGQNNAFDEKYSARIPMKRMARKIDIVGPMLFLASSASGYMTGQELYADGGLSAW